MGNFAPTGMKILVIILFALVAQSGQSQTPYIRNANEEQVRIIRKVVGHEAFTSSNLVCRVIQTSTITADPNGGDGEILTLLISVTELKDGVVTLGDFSVGDFFGPIQFQFHPHEQVLEFEYGFEERKKARLWLSSSMISWKE